MITSLGNITTKRFGFGGLPIQRSTIDEVFEIFDVLREKGINFIDTARGYTISEEYIGKAIQKDRDNWILASKSMSRTYEDMKIDINISLKNLGVEKIHLYQMHNVKIEEYDMCISDGYKALVEAKEKGYINHIGISTHSMDVARKAIDGGYFETIQIPYNIVENQGDEVLKLAKEKNMLTIIMKPLAGGAIKNTTLALKYILSNSNVDIVIPGVSKAQELCENAEILTKGYELSDEDIIECENIKKELGGIFCRRCEYCLPCEKNINIPLLFLLEGYYTRYDLKDWSIERYFAQGSNASDCIKCGQCEKRCPYNLPIIDMLENVAKTIKKD